MNDEQAVEVVICGAGAAGLTLALELARRGVRFRLVDKLDAPFHGSRGKGIQPRTLEVFEDLGILERVAAAGGPYPPLRTWQADGSARDTPAAEPLAPTPATPYAAPLMLPQFLTEDLMRERLLELGHAPEHGVTLDAVAQDGDGVRVTLSGAGGTRVLRARYLVGTDGGRSPVRHMLGIGFPGKTLGVRALVADVRLSGIEDDAWHRFNEGSMADQVALCPLAGTGLFQVQAPVPLEGEVDVSAAGLEALLATRTGRDGIRIHAVCWASVYGMQARLAERYRIGRVLLAGDAAHIHPPTGGQGLNTSIQDACNLGWKLAAVLGGADDALLDSYEEERRPVAADMLGLSTRLLDAATRGDMRRGPEVRQLDIGYPWSSLALTLGGREPDEVANGLANEPAAEQAGAPSTGQAGAQSTEQANEQIGARVRAGERAPDAPLRGAAGQALRLFEVFKGPHWTLLGYGIERDALRRWRRPGLHIHAIGPRGDLVDTAGHAADAYGLHPGDLVLVRPDGYVGAVVAADAVDADQADQAAAALDAYLARVGLAAA